MCRALSPGALELYLFVYGLELDPEYK